MEENNERQVSIDEDAMKVESKRLAEVWRWTELKVCNSSDDTPFSKM